MKTFEEQKFKIPKLIGISEKNIEEHLKLYSGYVKNANLIQKTITEYRNDKESEKHSYAISELQRRFSFEFGGMRNHEYYFSSLENGPDEIDLNGDLYQAIEKEWGDFEKWLSIFKTIAGTRGVGWAILYYDNKNDRLINHWIDEQHLGHLAGIPIILALDMWEHSYVADYQPSGKKNYINDFFLNLNWKVIEENFAKAKNI